MPEAIGNMPRDAASVTVSVVSHGQHALVNALLADLADCPEVGKVIITHNIPEAECAIPAALAGRVSVLRNGEPKGFGANHNGALLEAEGAYLCILNPDIRLQVNPFPALLDCMRRSAASLTAPRVLNPSGQEEDSARRFPTPMNLIFKALGQSDGRMHVQGNAPFQPDWVAGMFMLVQRDTFRLLGGFDEGFFLYYEDVDLCARLSLAGQRLVCCPGVSVIHDARRASRRQFRYMYWHGRSMLRYFIKHCGRLPQLESR